MMPIVQRVKYADVPDLVTLAEKIKSAGKKSFRKLGSVKEETDGRVEIQIEDAHEE